MAVRKRDCKLIRVLVVDDSGFFRRRICSVLESDSAISVVGTASNGAQALRQVAVLRPDVITMDVEMPVLDGISAVRQIMVKQPTPILMFSSLTQQGAKATFDALAAGAVDFLPKRFSDIADNPEEAGRRLCRRVKQLAVAQLARTRAVQEVVTTARVPMSRLRLVVIGASTGGPAALQRVLPALPAQWRVPLLLVQHMPDGFTSAFAQRLDEMSRIVVREARDGDLLEPGVALLAPGGRQTVIDASRGGLRVKVYEETDANIPYRPSLDNALFSAGEACRAKVLGIILTGMGRDGCEGARQLRRAGGEIWAQDEQSSVIFGMPGAVIQAGLADRVLSLSRLPTELGTLM